MNSGYNNSKDETFEDYHMTVNFNVLGREINKWLGIVNFSVLGRERNICLMLIRQLAYMII